MNKEHVCFHEVKRGYLKQSTLKKIILEYHILEKTRQRINTKKEMIV